MSRDPRKSFYDRDRVPIWGRSDYRSRDRPLSRKRTRSRSPPMGDKRRSGSPRKNEKDLLDENILREISKLPEPSELWDNNQFQENANYNSAPPPPAFQTEAVPNFQSNYQPSFSGIYDDFPPAAPPPTMPQEIASWNQMSLPPPPAPTPFVNNVEEQIKKEAAIETEMRHQKAALSKQREDYIKKASILKKELDTLKDQRDELRGDAKRSPSPDTKRFLKENTKLQLEIQNKLKTINNVVDMLNGIIGEEAHTEIVHDSDDSGKGSKQKSRSPSNKKFNYVYYDPEMHWCRVCNEFPPTAKDYLNHLHSAAHHKKLLRRMAAAHMEAPWHSVAGINEGFPNYPSAPTKRTPIKGLQFFVPSTAWYCKLCDQFIGDLHCASAHLKSVTHSKNYTNFVEQNPHWETDWMSDRQKAFEKARASNKLKAPEEKPQYTAHTITFHKDGFHTKNTDLPVAAPPEKKKKKEKKKKSKKKQSSSSSSSSNSSSSDSETEKKRKKSKTKKEKKIGATDEKTLTEWMTAIQMDRLNENDRKLLDTLKSRMKADKLKEEKRRSPDRDSSPDPRRKRFDFILHKYRDNERRDIDRDRRERNFRRSPSRSSRRSPRRSRSRSRARDSRESRESRARSPARAHSPPPDPKKPDIKKMPFIGKMPVYKHLGKKQEDQKKEEQDQKKKDEDEATKKRREEMDAEIQKKVSLGSPGVFEALQKSFRTARPFLPQTQKDVRRTVCSHDPGLMFMIVTTTRSRRLVIHERACLSYSLVAATQDLRLLRNQQLDICNSVKWISGNSRKKEQHAKKENKVGKVAVEATKMTTMIKLLVSLKNGLKMGSAKSITRTEKGETLTQMGRIDEIIKGVLCSRQTILTFLR
ncbi:unnamed protein product [Diatraea saccharalis]|uniref:U1-type domain-containing protein n=1 Tax=Diatraea saccharalis TaxID=40085 RepID=A0A9N9R961_9NEOP|nr:unnamed protein product [Diatraea saccharalis]